MLNTEFKIKKLEDWITMMIELDKKLKEFDKRQNMNSKMISYVGAEYFTVEIIIKDK